MAVSRQRCLVCGRFLRAMADAYTGAVVRWQCVKLVWVGPGQWEHQ